MIDSVSETLRTVLHNALSTLVPPSQADVSDLLGTIATTPPRVTIFLYEVVEDPGARNQPKNPRMPLLLRYLLTPWSSDPITDQRLLERTLQTFYDQPILNGAREALQVTLLPLSLEDKTRIWHAIRQPYRLSVVYEVRVVELDATVQRPQTPASQRDA